MHALPVRASRSGSRQIAYARGAYDACEKSLSKEEVADHLEPAATEARDYYQRLLISGAQEALAARP